MKNLAALTAVLALAAGLAACTSPGSSTAPATATATATPVSGTETLSGRLTGPAAASTGILLFHLRLTGPVGTTATIRLGTAVPEKYELYTVHTAVGDLAVTLASAGTSTGRLKSARTCLYVLTTAVPFTVDGASSTGTFAGATGAGTAVVVSSGDDPKLSDGTCNTSRDAPPSATTAVATFAATIKLTVRQ
jgi:hypothetical protein